MFRVPWEPLTSKVETRQGEGESVYVCEHEGGEETNSQRDNTPIVSHHRHRRGSEE